MDKIRIGTIGACGRGWLADLCHNPENGVEVVAGMDINEKQIEKFKNRFHDKYKQYPKGYTDYKEMLEKEKLDAVFITSPDFCHEEHAVYALSHGVAVYLEKPMAITVEGCDRILKTAKEYNSKIMVGHNMRYHNYTNQMKDIIDSGTIGKVRAIWCRHFISYGGDAYFRDWHADRSKSTSLLLQKGAHDIDIIHWLANSYSSQVSGIGNLTVYDKLPRRANPEEKPDCSFNASHWPPMEQSGFHPIMDVEDHNIINMQLANGVQACYMQCHYTPDCCRNYTIIGTKGRIENYGNSQEGTTVELWTKRKDTFRMHGDVTFRTPPDVGHHGGTDNKIINGFIEYIRDDKIPATSPKGARYSVATGCAGAQSIRSGGRPVKVAPLAEELETYTY